MQVATVDSQTTKPFTTGSVNKKGDRVCFIYMEDEDGVEHGYGTVIGEKDAETAIVLVILQGRRGQLRDELEIPYANLTPHLPEIEEAVNKAV